MSQNKNTTSKLPNQKKYTDGDEESVTSNINEWIVECNKVNDNIYFNSFRRQSIFKMVIEGTEPFGGLSNLKTIIKNPYFLKALPEIHKSDLYGNPENCIKFNIKDKQYFLTPTTIRYT